MLPIWFVLWTIFCLATGYFIRDLMEISARASEDEDQWW